MKQYILNDDLVLEHDWILKKYVPNNSFLYFSNSKCLRMSGHKIKRIFIFDVLLKLATKNYGADDYEIVFITGNKIHQCIDIAKQWIIENGHSSVDNFILIQNDRVMCEDVNFIINDYIKKYYTDKNKKINKNLIFVFDSNIQNVQQLNSFVCIDKPEKYVEHFEQNNYMSIWISDSLPLQKYGYDRYFDTVYDLDHDKDNIYFIANNDPDFRDIKEIEYDSGTETIKYELDL